MLLPGVVHLLLAWSFARPPLVYLSVHHVVWVYLSIWSAWLCQGLSGRSFFFMACGFSLPPCRGGVESGSVLRSRGVWSSSLGACVRPGQGLANPQAYVLLPTLFHIGCCPWCFPFTFFDSGTFPTCGVRELVEFCGLFPRRHRLRVGPSRLLLCLSLEVFLSV